jgi:rubredoxin
MPAPPEGSDAAKVSTMGGKPDSEVADMTDGPVGGRRDDATAVRAAPVGLARIDRFYSNARHSMKKYMCLICGWIYDEAAGAPEEGIAPGTKWEDVPPNWTCPECGARKEDFEMVEF